MTVLIPTDIGQESLHKTGDPIANGKKNSVVQANGTGVHVHNGETPKTNGFHDSIKIEPTDIGGVEGVSNQVFSDGGVLEPIAIVGLAFRFPGGATSEDLFWDMLMEKRNVSSEFPPDRLNIDGFYSSNEKKKNTVGSAWKTWK